MCIVADIESKGKKGGKKPSKKSKEADPPAMAAPSSEMGTTDQAEEEDGEDETQN